jgi:hypothetical protein
MDGAAPYTVETEFKAISYPQAWQHVLNMGHKFAATIMSHRLVEVDDDGVIDGELALPAVMAAERPPALTVKAEPKKADWYGEALILSPDPEPYPFEETSNDSAAA